MQSYGNALAVLLCGFLVLSFLAQEPSCGQDDSWVAQVRKDHPRLFFNADTWPAVKKRALTVLKDQLAKVKEHADGPPSKEEWSKIERPAPRPGSTLEVRDYGDQLMSSAFVYRVNPDPARLKKIEEMLQASVDYYNACYAQGKSVNWYSRTGIGWLCALDWVWEDLTPQERRDLGLSMMKHVDEVLHKPNIERRNGSGHTTGYYGENNMAFFAGVLFLNEGLDDKKALEFLKTGYDVYQKLFAHRAEMCGDDGGAASPTLGYSFNEYPCTEWNFLYTWQAATGEDISAKWPYIAMLPNYMMWNWLPGDPALSPVEGLEFGYGDTPHATNKQSRWWPYTHMSHIMHFYGQSHPDLAAQAAYMRQRFTPFYHNTAWPVYPFVMTNNVFGDRPAEPAGLNAGHAGLPIAKNTLEKAPPPQNPESLPSARYFENMGQVFMRSGDGPQDTYALFACGGITGQHRHFDALHFTIFKMGFLALDTGTREGNTDNLQNYFAQTIAHNCILIKMPGEPPTPYWNGTVYGQAGGQNKSVGSKVIAFETCKDFSYVAGDATPVYNSAKCKQMVRQLVFIPPDHFVVFDRAASTKPDYKKTWLLHHANEPTMVDEKTWRSDQDRGRIFCRTLLPEDAVLEKVGGPGKEFLVEGVNYSITQGPSEPIKKLEYGNSFQRPLQYKEVPELMGRWRMEVRPGAPRTDDVFLHLIQVGDQKLEKMCDAKAASSSAGAEVTFTSGDKTIALRFSTTGDVGGHIRIASGDRTLLDRPLANEVMPQSGLAEQPASGKGHE